MLRQWLLSLHLLLLRWWRWWLLRTLLLQLLLPLRHRSLLTPKVLPCALRDASLAGSSVCCGVAARCCLGFTVLLLGELLVSCNLF